MRVALAIGEIIKDINKAGATAKTEEEVVKALIAGGAKAERVVEAAKKDMKETIGKLMKNYDTTDLKNTIEAIYDVGYVEAVISGESYKASLKVKDYIAGLEARLDGAKNLDELKERYDAAKDEAEKVTGDLTKTLGQALAAGN